MLTQQPNAVAKQTMDLENAKADFARDGYCILPNVLSETEVAAVRKRLADQAAAERALGWARMRDGQTTSVREGVVAAKRGANQRVGMLVNKGKVFRDLVEHPVALELVEFALGGSFLLSSCDANIANKGGALEGLHRDAWWCPIPYREGDAFVKVGDRQRYMAQPDCAPPGTNVPPACVNIIWMLTDFTDENGGTRLVPGSHRRPDSPDGSVPHKVPTIAATGKAGSCMFFDGRLWHGTGQNTTDASRMGVLAFYCGPKFRQAENYFLGLDPAILEEASDRFLDLLGYTTFYGYGNVNTYAPTTRPRGRGAWTPEMKIDQ